MRLIDTHCHLTSNALAGRVTEVWRRACAAGVTRMVTIGTDGRDSGRAVAATDQLEGVYAAVGIHPHEAAKVRPDDFRLLRELRHHPHVVAWGEIGLDYHYDSADRMAQQRAFATQLELAAAADLPVIIQCREAFADTLKLMDEHQYAGRKVVFHCFTGARSEAEAIAARGWRLSFTGIVTFRNSGELQELATAYPLDKLMLETDSPYLAPEPHRNVKPNEPAMLVCTASFLAELRGLTMEEMATLTTRNAEEFFGLEPEPAGDSL